MGMVEDVQMFLAQYSPAIIDGSTGWPSVRRRVHDDSDQLVVLTEDGGFEPETPSAEGLGDSALKQPAVQVRVRGEPWDSDASYEKAQEIMDALHGVMRQDVGYGYYLRIKAQTSGPVFIGFDDRGRPEHTISFRAVQAA